MSRVPPNSRIVPTWRELELDWPGVIQEADDVLDSRRGVARGLTEPPVTIAGLVPEVVADGKDGSAEATRPILVRDEAVAWRQNRAPRSHESSRWAAPTRMCRYSQFSC